VSDLNQASPEPIGIQTHGSGELTRGEVILKGALAAGAAYGLAAIGPFARQALAATEGGDLEILNFLLPFEYLQADLYSRGKSERNDYGERMPLTGEWKELIGTILDEERQHVDALTKAIGKLGGKPVEKGSYAFAFRAPEAFFVIAGNLEKSAIGVYNGIIPEIKSKSLRELAASIVQVEGRHAAAVRTQVPEEPAPEAFDVGITKFSAVSSVEKFTGEF
jgi:rubrerythrin